MNKITSIHTQLPYKYYDLPFCRPATVEDTRESLGELLMGDVIENSLYKVFIVLLLYSTSPISPLVSMQLRAKVNQTCVVVCKKTFNKAEISLFAERIRQEYRAHWWVHEHRLFLMQRTRITISIRLLDSLPGAEKHLLMSGRHVVSLRLWLLR